jgi:N4-gp56 family major capsid protein
MINGEQHYVCLMNYWQTYDVRTSTTSNEWLDLQKAAMGAEGKKSPVFKGTLGMYNNVVMHEHQSLIRFNDYGSGGDVDACRALFMGEQAAALAFGSPGTGLRFSWHEETRDNANQVVITTSSIFGLKKVNWNGKDYGVMAMDTAAAKP